MSEPVLWDARNLIASFADGDDLGWHEELLFLWTTDRERTIKLLDEIACAGSITDPVLIGSDNRVWDGHHRVAVALALGMAVPVVMAA